MKQIKAFDKLLWACSSTYFVLYAEAWVATTSLFQLPSSVLFSVKGADNEWGDPVSSQCYRETQL